MDKERQRDEEEQGGLEEGKRTGSIKRSKAAGLEIHKEMVIPLEHIPKGRKFKGYQNWVVQDLIIGTFNTLYRLERWETAKGEYIVVTR